MKEGILSNSASQKLSRILSYKSLFLNTSHNYYSIYEKRWKSWMLWILLNFFLFSVFCFCLLLSYFEVSVFTVFTMDLVLWTALLSLSHFSLCSGYIQGANHPADLHNTVLFTLNIKLWWRETQLHHLIFARKSGKKNNKKTKYTLINQQGLGYLLLCD